MWCPCPFNVTYGFELMLNSESEHNFFRFLQCHNVDITTLKGGLNDAACKLLPYILNRELMLLYLKQWKEKKKNPHLNHQWEPPKRPQWSSSRRRKADNHPEPTLGPDGMNGMEIFFHLIYNHFSVHAI